MWPHVFNSSKLNGPAAVGSKYTVLNLVLFMYTPKSVLLGSVSTRGVYEAWVTPEGQSSGPRGLAPLSLTVLSSDQGVAPADVQC